MVSQNSEVRQRQLVGGRVRERERAPDDMGILFRYNKFGLESNLPHQRGGMHVCVFPPEFENKRTAGSAHYHLNKICEMSGEPKILHAFTNNNSYAF